jgi:prepilin-type N-terminal cleavage/methylation domain-containing protein
MTERLHDERGFTLVELMMTLVIGLIIVLSSLAVLDGATRHSDEVQRRSGAVLQGRAAMDDVVRSLRSQVCVQTDDSTILTPVTAASATSVTFYSDFGDGTTVPDRHTISLGADGRLTDVTVKGSGTLTQATFTATPKTRVIATGLSASPSTPVFQFYGFTSATPPTADQALNSTATPTVAAADLPKIARIRITLQANPEGKVNDKLAATLQDDVFVRLADPDDPAPTPRCT